MFSTHLFTIFILVYSNFLNVEELVCESYRMYKPPDFGHRKAWSDLWQPDFQRALLVHVPTHFDQSVRITFIYVAITKSRMSSALLFHVIYFTLINNSDIHYKMVILILSYHLFEWEMACCLCFQPIAHIACFVCILARNAVIKEGS